MGAGGRVLGGLLALALVGGGAYVAVQGLGSDETDQASTDFSTAAPAPKPTGLKPAVTFGKTPSSEPSGAGATTAPEDDEAPSNGVAPDADVAGVAMPKVDIDQDIKALGLSAAGEINPPPGTTMWYTDSAKPGEPGISVIAAHVLYNSQPDNFYNLVNSRAGDPVELTYSDGTVVEYKVTRTKASNKEDLQRDPEVWGDSDKPVLALITCDPASPVSGQHHEDNYVVFAEPVKATTPGQ